MADRRCLMAQVEPETPRACGKFTRVLPQVSAAPSKVIMSMMSMPSSETGA
jgi:hypothetical protein